MIVYINTLVMLSIIYDGPHNDYYFLSLLSPNLGQIQVFKSIIFQKLVSIMNMNIGKQYKMSI